MPKYPVVHVVLGHREIRNPLHISSQIRMNYWLRVEESPPLLAGSRLMVPTNYVDGQGTIQDPFHPSLVHIGPDGHFGHMGKMTNFGGYGTVE